ncbi:MAG: SDR family NAD(P)-dependent oxidoreductase, partial [Chitinophagaceae bacterium]
MGNYLVIGGSSGIGLSIVQQLADSGNHVWATYNQHPVENVAGIHYFPLDIMSDSLSLDIPDILDGLVYCPGKINLKPFARIDEKDFILDYQIQVLGAVKVIKAVLPNLKKSQQSSIVLFSTVAVQTGFNFHSLVASSKGALEGLTKALAAEFAPAIRVNAIAPSITQTPLADPLLNTPEKKEANANRHPLKRIGMPQDIADA